jgi:hypothetical protein
MVQAVWPDPRTAPAVAEVAPPPAPVAKAAERVDVPIPLGPVVPGPKYNDLMTAVLYADRPAVGDLLQLGRWPDKPDSHGMTPLTAAAMLGDVSTAELLLKAGASPSPAVPIARERGDRAMTTLLERYTK